MPAPFRGDNGTADVPTTVMVQSPAFRFRAGFPNDEDLFANWSPSPLGENVWSLEAYDRYFETMLRAKANALLVGTNPFPDDRAVKLAARRGLTVMHHHYNLLGSQVTRWPLGRDGWDLDSDPQAMAHVWRASIAAQRDYDVIWSVGLRGLNDYAYPCPDAASCSRQINDALTNMSAWVREAQGEDARMVVYLWDELLQYLQDGLLHVPDGVKIIFGDEGAGMVHGSSLLGEYADGLYDHSAMYNYKANQLTEMIPVDRIITQVVQTFMAAARELFVFVLNTSDLRPALMTSRAYLMAAWDPAAVALPGMAPLAAASDYYAAFARDYYGLGAGNDTAVAASAWQQWFAAPLIQGGRSDNWIADQAIGPLADALADAARAGRPLSAATKQTVNDTLSGCDPATLSALASAYNGMTALAGRVPPSRAAFFASHAVANMAHGHFGCRAALSVAAAAEAYEAADLQAARAYAAAAEAEVAALMAARRGGEQGQWSGWYFGDHLTDFHSARRSVRNAVAGLSEAKAPGPANTGAVWYAFEDYQLAFASNYPLLYRSRDWNLGEFVRVHCVSPDVKTGNCVNRPDGGRWRPQTGVAVELLFGPPGGEGQAGLQLRFTLDGSDPGPSSLLYGGPLKPDAIANSTGGFRLRARAQVNGTMLDVVSDNVWQSW